MERGIGGCQAACTTKTKDRGEGQAHKQRENEAAVDEELFEGSAQNEQRRPEALEDDGAGRYPGAGVEPGKPGADHAVARHGPIHAGSCPRHGAHRSRDGETEDGGDQSPALWPPQRRGCLLRYRYDRLLGNSSVIDSADK